MIVFFQMLFFFPCLRIPIIPRESRALRVEAEFSIRFGIKPFDSNYGPAQIFESNFLIPNRIEKSDPNRINILIRNDVYRMNTAEPGSGFPQGEF
jgi:hypothetical protein